MTSRCFTAKQPALTPATMSIPLLPGNNFHDDPLVRRNQRKAHHLDVVSGVPTVATSLPRGYRPPAYETLNSKADELIAARGGLEGLDEEGENYTPPWLTEDIVLSFAGYFKEAISESAIEKIRLRRVSVFFHTEDESILVREVAPHNSGIPQGALIRRHRIPRSNGAHAPKVSDGFLGQADLNVGQEVTMYGKTFYLYSCDQPTRKYLEAKGIQVPSNENYPSQEDQFAQYAARRAMHEMKPRKELNANDMELKRHHEYGNAGRVTKPTPVQVSEAQQFFANDGRVLSFFAVWDDRLAPHGDVHWLKLNYYLADDTLELMHVKSTGGREPQGKILVRQKVPRPSEGSGEKVSLLDTLKTTAIQHSTFGVKLASDYITARDLKVGQMLQLHGKPLLLYDCAPGTRTYYKQEYSMDQPQALDVNKRLNIRTVEPPGRFPPPHDGLGSEEDSLGNWKHILLKPVTKDYRNWAANHGKQYRFILRMVPTPNAVIEEEGRHVLLTFFLEDNTLQLDEIPVRNSGVLGGKYLCRQKVKQILPDGRWVFFQPTDFAIGNTVEILGRKFDIIAEDERTTKLRNGIEDEPSLDDVRAVIERMKLAVHTKYGRSQEAFRAIAAKSNNSIDLAEFVQFFKNLHLELRRPLAKLIFHYYDKNGDGVLNYSEFVSMLESPPPETAALEEASASLDTLTLHSPRSVMGGLTMDLSPTRTRVQSGAPIEDHIDRAQRQSDKKYTQKRVMRLLRDKLEERRVDTVEVFRLMGGTRSDCTIQQKDFERGVRETLHMLLSPAEMQVLLDTFFPGGRPLAFPDFVEILQGKEESLQRVNDQTPPNPALRRLITQAPRAQISGIPIIDVVRQKVLLKGGRSGFRDLARVLLASGNRQMSRREIQTALIDFGIRLTVPELGQLMSFLDRNGSSQVSPTDFIQALRGEMNQRRRDVVHKAYQLISETVGGEVTVASLGQLFDASVHPEVLGGNMTDTKVHAEFLQGWTQQRHQKITLADFMDYYGNLSAGSDSDDYFELMVRNSWHLSGGSGVAANTSCRRVLVTRNDGTQSVEIVNNDLGVGPDDRQEMLRRLEQQGVTGIKKIEPYA